ncbi:MAG: hypothetical protein WA461_02945 [Nitrososphaeraceae archaeon]
MTKHHHKPRTAIKQQPQQQPKEKGWYCLAHSVLWLCDICGSENKKIGEIKYYFVSGLSG